MWLGEVFPELGFQAFPALHCRQALALAKRLERPINALLVNPELPGATRTIKTLVAANPGVRVILIRNPRDRHPVDKPGPRRVKAGIQPNPDGFQADSTLERPSPWDPISLREWVAKVRRLLVND